MKFTTLAVAYVVLIVLGDWLAAKYVWPVGFGYSAPAGVYAIGLTLGLRDWLHELRGLRWTLPLVYISGILAWIISSTTGWATLRDVAIASVVAFTISETADSLVYHPLAHRHPIPGLVLSNTVGLVLDSLIFLSIAFGSLTFLRGQIIGKAEMTVLAMFLVLGRRHGISGFLLGYHRARQLFVHPV